MTNENHYPKAKNKMRIRYHGSLLLVSRITSVGRRATVHGDLKRESIFHFDGKRIQGNHPW